jgi:hypothetical protein
VARAAGLAATIVVPVAFLLWTLGIWSESDDDSLWKLAGIFDAWSLALVEVTTLRLMSRTEVIARTLVLATAACALGAAFVGSLMILTENGGAWRLLAVLIILAVLGFLLTPIVQRLQRAAPS